MPIAVQEKTARSSWKYELIGPALLVLVIIGLLWPALFGSSGQVLSAAGTDIEMQFFGWRQFGFGELAKGHFPLWNPHVFCGTPFVGSLQSALLYPPNWIFLILPLVKAVNWNIATHAMLAGIAMYSWARYRRVSRTGATLAGLTYMLSAHYFLHIMPGHLPWLCVTAWTPMVLMCCDGLIDIGENAPPKKKSLYRQLGPFRPYIGWMLFGAFILTMQVLAGYPQPVYVAGLIGSIYLALNLLIQPLLDRLFRRPGKKYDFIHITKGLCAWFGIYVIAALICAVQLGAGIATANESGRAGGTPFEFSASYNMPWQNLITILVPHFWGTGLGQGNTPSAYTSEWLIWEMIAFFGTISLALIILQLIAGSSRSRRFGVGIAIFSTIVCLGITTPLYKLMFDLVPGFSRFRGPSKWFWVTTLLLCPVVGMGWDVLRSRTKSAHWPAIFLGIAGLAILGFGHHIQSSAGQGTQGYWGQTLSWMAAHDHQVVSSPLMGDAKFIEKTGGFTATQCYWAAGTMLLGAILFMLTRSQPRVAWLIAILIGAEMIVWAHSTYVTTDPIAKLPAPWAEYADKIRGDRVFYVIPRFENAPMTGGIDSIWGYDPIVLRRYVQFMVYCQNYEGKHTHVNELVDSSIPIQGAPEIFAMLRCRAVMLVDRGQAIVAELPEPMLRLHLIHSAEIVPGRNASFRRMSAPGFDPRTLVLLEKEPEITPTGSDGYAEVVHETTDEIEIKATAKQPTILLMTDAYSTGWRVRALPDSSQSDYQVMPANWVLRAVPLKAGTHHFIMEYRPAEYVAGKWISIVSLPLYLVGLGLVFTRRSNKKPV